MGWIVYLVGTIMALGIAFSVECRTVPAYERIGFAMAWPAFAGAITMQVLLFQTPPNQGLCARGEKQ